MIKHLVTNGCSWTAGNELECDMAYQDYLIEHELRHSPVDKWVLIDKNNKPAGHVNDYWCKFNWPGKLSEKLAIPTLIDQSVGGGSNSRILRQTCEFIKNYPIPARENLLLVIGWTISDRQELYLDNGQGYADWVQFNSSTQFSKSIHREFSKDKDFANSIDQFQKNYITSIDTEYAQLYQYFQQIYLLSSLLSSLNIKYLFFNALTAWWEAGSGKYILNVDEVFKKELAWQNSHPNMMHHNRGSMHSFVHRNAFPRGPDKHPLALAHDLWAEYILTQLKQRGIVQ